MNKTIKVIQCCTFFAILLTNFDASAARIQGKQAIFQEELEQSFSLQGLDAKIHEQMQQKSSHTQSLAEVKKNYQQVIALFQEKNFGQARHKLAELIKNNPQQSIYFYLKALLQIFDKNLNGAELSFQKAIELNDSNVPAYVGLAKLMLDKRNFKLAKEYANKALQKDPKALNAYKVLADIILNQQGIDAVETFLQNHYEKIKNNPNVELGIFKMLGRIYISKKQPEKLLQFATELNQRHDDVHIRAYLAEVQLANRKFVDAEKNLRNVIALEPNNSRYLFTLARLLGEQQGDETEVLQLLDKAAANVENPLVILSYKASYFIRKKQFQAASIVARKIEEDNPDASIGKILLADIYLAEQNYPKALKNYLTAYQISPNSKILDNILFIYTEQNNNQQAIDFMEKELAKNPDNAKLQYRLAIAYQNSENYPFAINYYEKALSHQPNNPLILNNLAWAYHKIKSAKALKLAEKAYKLAAKSGVVADTYGYILLKQGAEKESLKVLQQAVKQSPSITVIQLHLAESLIANQNRQQAKAILEKLITVDDSTQAAAKKLLESLNQAVNH